MPCPSQPSRFNHPDYIRMCCFSVTDTFLTFYYVEKRNGVLRKNGGEGFEKSYMPLHECTGVKNFQNHPYVINIWPLIQTFNEQLRIYYHDKVNFILS